MTQTMNAGQAAVGRVFNFTGDVLKKQGVGGGGGRRSDFLDAINTAIAAGKGIAIPVEIPEGKTFSEATKRYTSRVYRKGAIRHPETGVPLPFVLRTDPANKEIQITPPPTEVQAGAANAGATNNGVANAGTGGINVQLPTPKQGETLEVQMPGQAPIIVSHKRTPEATVETPAKAKGHAGRPKGSGKNR